MRAVGCLLPRSAAATFGFRAEWRKLLASRPSLPGRHSIAGRDVPELRTVHSADVTQDPGYRLSERQKIIGMRALKSRRTHHRLRPSRT